MATESSILGSEPLLRTSSVLKDKTFLQSLPPQERFALLRSVALKNNRTELARTFSSTHASPVGRREEESSPPGADRRKVGDFFRRALDLNPGYGSIAAASERVPNSSHSTPLAVGERERLLGPSRRAQHFRHCGPGQRGREREEHRVRGNLMLLLSPTKTNSKGKFGGLLFAALQVARLHTSQASLIAENRALREHSKKLLRKLAEVQGEAQRSQHDLQASQERSEQARRRERAVWEEGLANNNGRVGSGLLPGCRERH